MSPRSALVSAAAAADTTRELAEALKHAIRGEVEATSLARGLYSGDASNYRVTPQVVAFPADEADVAAISQVARRFEAPITMRGAGTSCAGNAIGPGIVVVTARHMNQILDIDVGARLVRVQPGVVLDSLQRALAPRGLRFGPDPSSQSRCTIGGMIGNNACGNHAVAYGRTADNVEALTVIDGRGRPIEAGAGGLGQVPGLAELTAANLAVIRTEFGRFSRQISGYGLDHLLPEKSADLAKALVGSEGTLGLVTAATLRLVPLAPSPALAVLGYPTLADAADAVPAILPHRPLAVEGLDWRLLEAYRLQVGQPPELPQGGAWLMVEATDPQQAELIGRAGGTPHVRVLPFGPESRAMWRIRQDGAGLAGRSPRGRQSYPGFEDAAVPPGRLGSYLRRFEELLAEFDLEGIPYGHLGDGCVHIRIDFPFDRGPAPSGSPGGGVRPGRLRFGGAARHSGTRPGPAKRGTPRRGAAVAPSGADGSGVTEAGVITAGVGERSGARVFREFMAAAGALAVEHGGSLSGEHGDGRSRSELLALMYTPAAVSLMEQVKGLFDPWNQLNPGIGPRPVQLDADLRRPASRPLSAAGGFTFGQDQGDLTKAAHRCTGVAKCQAAAGPFMCPSFLATGQEKDSTRGRARILQEVANGSLIGPGFDAPELAEVLKLCLACKACSKDCPAAVDMAKLKSEALFRRYRGKPRPIVHYLLGWLPRWEALAARNPALANFALHAPLITKALLRAGGMDPRRSLPRFAAASFQTQAAVSGFAAAADTAAVRGPSPVVVWGDSFSSKLAPGVGQAVARVLAAAGHTVHIAPEGVCCGLTWITTGQLGGAKRRLRSLLDVLGPFAVNGVPIVGVEPSCLAALRSDLPDLLATDPRAAVVARATKTLAEVLTADLAAGWRGPSLDGVEVVAQPHCHHHSVMGWEADRELLTRLGAQVQELHGCCGMAGNFGMERGNYEVSVKIAQGSLLPALADASEAVFLADGFSCRTQAADLAGRDGKHLAELLADRLDDAV